MGVQLVPVRTDVPDTVAATLRSLYDAVSQLQQPGSPVSLASVALKADLPPAADWPETAILCSEINSIVCSTLSAGSYAWLRADGSAL
jgi:hypothetical protein